MTRVLVVATKTPGTEQLAAALRDHVGDEVEQVHVLVPAGPLTDEEHELVEQEFVGGGVDDEGEEAAMARWRLRHVLGRLEELGVEASGHIGDDDPLTAVDDALERVPADRILVFEAPPTPAEWTRLDVSGQVERGLGVPVDKVDVSESVA